MNLLGKISIIIHPPFIRTDSSLFVVQIWLRFLLTCFKAYITVWCAIESIFSYRKMHKDGERGGGGGILHNFVKIPCHHNLEIFSIIRRGEH